jgi:deoxyadenosine/deoxycytidine kinase
MTSYLKKPDLIIYLRAETDTLISRIKNRGRDYENSIDPEYVHTLNVSYDRWIRSITDQPVMTIQTDDFNIFKDTKRFKDIEEEILERL